MTAAVHIVAARRTLVGILLLAAASVVSSCTSSPALRSALAGLDFALASRAVAGGELRSPFERGTVVAASEAPDNETGLGRFVFVRYDLGYSLGGRFIPEVEAYLLLSGLTELAVSADESIGLDQAIGNASADRLRMLLVTPGAESGLLESLTGAGAVRHGEWWYWDPTFLFR